MKLLDYCEQSVGDGIEDICVVGVCVGYQVVYPRLDLLAVIVVNGIVDVCNWGNIGVLCFY